MSTYLPLPSREIHHIMASFLSPAEKNSFGSTSRYFKVTMQDARNALLKAALPSIHKNIVIINEDWLELMRIALKLDSIANVALKALTILHTHKSPLTLDERGWAVKQAVEGGHLEILLALFADGPFPDTDRGWALGQSTAKGHIRMVQDLLDNGPISEPFRGCSVRRAARDGNLDIVRVLLANSEISDLNRSEAIQRAKEHGHLEIAKFLENCCFIGNDHNESIE